MERKRLFIDRKTRTGERVKLVKLAAKNKCDAIVIPLGKKLSARSEYIKLAKQFGLAIEAGGRDLSLLMPRRLFFLRRSLFRMEQGKRSISHHFCPTNPKSLSVIKKQAKKFFTQFMQALTTPRIFHLLPDEGQETTWCACPACRAFNPAEQNIIAVNIAADVLAKLDPEAQISYLDFGNSPIAPGVTPRKNMFALSGIDQFTGNR